MYQLVTRIGASNANSFVTLDQANYILPKVSPDDLEGWNTLTGDQQRYRLALGAILLGFLPLKGRVAYIGQALCFPRAYWNSVTAIWECTYRIPDQVKEAQCLAAYCVAHRALANRPDVDAAIEDPIKRLSIGGALDITFGDLKIPRNTLNQLLTSPTAIVYVWMKNFISQFRGGAISAVGDTDIYEYPETLTSTTTTTSTTSTTTTTSSTTTTTTTTAP